MKRLAILRPEPGASATLERARCLGLEVFILPLFEIVALGWQAPGPGGFDGVLLTSANALRYGGEGLQALRGLPVYAVGEATAKAARGAGFVIAATGNAGVERLLGAIDPGLRLFHPCGRDTTGASSARQTIISVPVYESRAIDDVPGIAQLSGCVAVVHSPRAGRRLAELAVGRKTIAIAAMSPAAAASAGSGWAAVETADTANDIALLALAARLCKKGGRQ